MPENELTSTEKVTVQRILNHTAGLTVWGFPGYDKGDDVPSVVEVLWTKPSELIQYAIEIQRIYQTGEKGILTHDSVEAADGGLGGLSAPGTEPGLYLHQRSQTGSRPGVHGAPAASASASRASRSATSCLRASSSPANASAAQA